GIERGDRVAIRLPNGVDWTVAFFGSLMAGAIVIPVNTRFAEPEIQYVLEDSQAKHVFMPGEALPAGDPFVLEDIGPADVAAIFWLAINQPDFRNLDVSHVRWAVYGGAPMPPEQVIQMMHDFPNARLGNGYGLTETSSVTTFLPHEYCEDHPETVGFAAPVSELRLETEGFEGGAGELLVRGPQVVAGYWRKEEATARTMVDGWLHTGDVATIDDDGFVSIVDRMKDMINPGGENVYSI